MITALPSQPSGFLTSSSQSSAGMFTTLSDATWTIALFAPRSSVNVRSSTNNDTLRPLLINLDRMLIPTQDAPPTSPDSAAPGSPSRHSLPLNSPSSHGRPRVDAMRSSPSISWRVSVPLCPVSSPVVERRPSARSTPLKCTSIDCLASAAHGTRISRLRALNRSTRGYSSALNSTPLKDSPAPSSSDDEMYELKWDFRKLRNIASILHSSPAGGTRVMNM